MHCLSYENYLEDIAHIMLCYKHLRSRYNYLRKKSARDDD